jgi:hypothetical protein
MASSLELITTPRQAQAELESSFVWAQEITFCTPAVDSWSGRWDVWQSLRRHGAKLKHAFVALDAMKTEPAALEWLHALGKLRLIAAADGSFRAHAWMFTRGTRARVLIGSGAFLPAGMMTPLEALVRWEGSSLDPFLLQVEALLGSARKAAQVPTRKDLDEYNNAFAEAIDLHADLVGLGAPFMRHRDLDAELPQLTLIENRGSIAQAVQQVEQAFQDAATMSEVQVVAFRGGSVELMVHWIAPLRVWGFFAESEGSYWNGFGIKRPVQDERLGITVEINPPPRGIERRMQGAIGLDPSSGGLCLLHRGKIGGRKGVGAGLFWKRFRGGVRLKESDRDVPSRAVVVGQIGSPDFVRDVAAFVHEVARIKAAVP